MTSLFFQITMVLYFVGTIFFLIYLLRRSEALSKVALGIAGLGFLVHTAALFGQTIALGHLQIIRFQEAMSFFAWALVFVFLIVVWTRKLHVLGSFILPLAFLSLVSASIAPAEVHELSPVFRTVWVHVTLSMLGTVGFAVAFVAGIMYVMQDRLLKSKHFNVLYSKLPPLDFLDTLNQRSILLGFPFLTLGILTGAVSAHISFGSYLSWNSEQIWALVTWVFYFSVLLGRITMGWRAKKAAYLTIVGFAGVILTFVGVVLKNDIALTNL